VIEVKNLPTMTANNETAPKDFNKTRFGVETNLLFINVFPSRGGLVVRSHGRQVDLGRTSGLPVWKYPGAYGVAVSNMILGLFLTSITVQTFD
jgi:hypothetical protein